MKIKIDYSDHPDYPGSKHVIVDECGSHLPEESIINKKITKVETNSFGEIWLDLE
jgi:hypothetical protein